MLLPVVVLIVALWLVALCKASYWTSRRADYRGQPSAFRCASRGVGVAVFAVVVAAAAVDPATTAARSSWFAFMTCIGPLDSAIVFVAAVDMASAGRKEWFSLALFGVLLVSFTVSLAFCWLYVIRPAAEDAVFAGWFHNQWGNACGPAFAWAPLRVVLALSVMSPGFLRITESGVCAERSARAASHAYVTGQQRSRSVRAAARVPRRVHGRF